jgi:hypothetical protein
MIQTLRQVAAACAGLGMGLLLAAIVLIPILGFASAAVGAVGTWCLLLAALAVGLLLAGATVNRARHGHCFFGERGDVLWFATGRGRAVALVVILIILIGVLLI